MYLVMETSVELMAPLVLTLDRPSQPSARMLPHRATEPSTSKSQATDGGVYGCQRRGNRCRLSQEHVEMAVPAAAGRRCCAHGMHDLLNVAVAPTQTSVRQAVAGFGNDMLLDFAFRLRNHVKHSHPCRHTSRMHRQHTQPGRARRLRGHAIAHRSASGWLPARPEWPHASGRRNSLPSGAATDVARRPSSPHSRTI